jgi:hypothetical protein
MENSTPPRTLPLSTAGRMLGEAKLLDALQRGVRQAFAFLDGSWGTIPPLWWYRFTEIVWYRQRVTFVVDGRLIEAIEIVIDRPRLLSEERKDLVEAMERRNRVQEMAEAIELAGQSAKTDDRSSEKRQLFDAWWEAETRNWGSCPPVEASKDGRETVRKWAERHRAHRGTAEGWARDKAPVKRGRRPSKKTNN